MLQSGCFQIKIFLKFESFDKTYGDFHISLYVFEISLWQLADMA